MSLNFPPSPSAGDAFTAEGRTFVWNGSLWLMQAEDIPWATLEQALAGLSADTIMSPATMRAAIEATEPPPPEFGPLVCRAWGRINGATGEILAHRNIASVVMSPDGQYAVTFQTPMQNANYLVLGGTRRTDTNGACIGLRIGVEPTVNGFSYTNGVTGGSGVVGFVLGSGNSFAVFG